MTRIITPEEVVRIALPQNQNFDSAFIEDQILIAQDKYIKRAVGEDFWNEFTEEFDSSSGLTSLNTTLLKKYIHPALARYVVYESLPYIQNQLTSSGIMVNRTESSDPVSGSGFQIFSNKVLSDAEFYRNQMLEFMDDNDDSNTMITSYYLKNKSQSSKGGGFVCY